MKELGEIHGLQTIIFWDETVLKGALPSGGLGSGYPLIPPKKRRATFPKTTAETDSPGLKSNLPPSDPESPIPDGPPVNFLDNWTKAICQQAPKADPLPEVQTVLADFLRKNPHLESDQRLANMVLFCLKNYINMDPDFAQKSFAEKLEDANALAGKFILATGQQI
jgi:hypothetical protein